MDNDFDPESHAHALKLAKQIVVGELHINGHEVYLFEPDSDGIVGEHPVITCSECSTMRSVPETVLDCPEAQMYLVGWYGQFDCDGVVPDNQNL